MKLPRILGLVFVLLFTFGAPALRAQADVKPGAAQARFRLLFNSYAGEPGNPPREKMEFQINTIDLKQPSEFLQLGHTIAHTKWKLTKFESKTVLDPKTEEKNDVSELTVVNTDTKQEVVLILGRATDVNDTAHPTPKK